MESSADLNIYSLDYVVRSCLADIDEPDSSPVYTKFLKWANDGYRRLNLAGLMPITMKSVVDGTPKKIIKWRGKTFLSGSLKDVFNLIKQL